MEQFYVEVVNSETGEVVNTLGPAPERKADKIEDGVNINLNHEKYHTRLRKAD